MAAIAINSSMFTGLNGGTYITATKSGKTILAFSQWKTIEFLIWNTGSYEGGLTVRCIKR